MSKMCVYFKIRSKKNIKYYFCVFKKTTIKLNQCKDCNYKAYKNKRFKTNSRKKATDIDIKVKQAVGIRDNYRCVICGKVGIPNAHFVKRSQGGLGIEENIITLCVNCHYEEDFGKNTKEYEKKIEKYLKNYYGASWSKEKLIYKKG